MQGQIPRRVVVGLRGQGRIGGQKPRDPGLVPGGDGIVDLAGRGGKGCGEQNGEEGGHETPWPGVERHHLDLLF